MSVGRLFVNPTRLMMNTLYESSLFSMLTKPHNYLSNATIPIATDHVPEYPFSLVKSFEIFVNVFLNASHKNLRINHTYIFMLDLTV